MKSAIQAFVDRFDSIIEGTFEDDLVGIMSLSELCAALKNIMRDHIYSHVEIAYREQTAQTVIAGLLSTIVHELQKRPNGPLARSTYRAAPSQKDDKARKLSENYQLAQRATDYVAGMTDGYALTQYQRISGMM